MSMIFAAALCAVVYVVVDGAVFLHRVDKRLNSIKL